MRIITFGKINKKFLIPIIGGVLSLIYRFIANCNPKYKTASTNPFIMSIYTALGMILSFIPYLIVKYRSKKTNLNIIENKTKLNQVFTHHYIFNNKSLVAKYKLIILSAVFDFIETSLVLVFCTKCIYNLWIFDILFISLFSYWLLKAKLYKHQYLSMIIIIILGLVLNILEYYKSGTDNEFNILEIIIKFIGEIFLSLNIVIAKYNMEKNYCTPYEICIWEGFIGLFVYIICLLIINKFELTIAEVKYPDNFFELINNYNINDFFLCLLVVIVSSIFNIFKFLTCDYFTPFHIIILSIIHECYYYIKANENLKLNIIGFFILLFIINISISII